MKLLIEYLHTMLKEHCCASLYWHSVVQHLLQCLSVTNTAVKSTVCVCKLHYSPCSIVPISHSLSSVLSPFLFKLAFRETTVYYPFIQKIALHPKSHILYTVVHTHTHTHTHTQTGKESSSTPVYYNLGRHTHTNTHREKTRKVLIRGSIKFACVRVSA